MNQISSPPIHHQFLFKPISIKIVGHLPHLQQVFRYLPMNADGRLFNTTGDTILATRQAQESPRKDIFTHLLASDPETGLKFSQQDLKQHVLLTVTVGAHSISTTLTRIFAVLASQPDCQARIRQELKDAFDGNGFPPIEIVTNLKYLEALETGDFIPESTQIWIGQHVLMSDERCFPRAAEFLPERWMDQDTKESGNGNGLIKDRRAWIPFGYGAHACAGRALAMEELKLIVARIVRDFDIRFGEDQTFHYDEWAKNWKDFFLTVIEQIDLRFMPRAEIGTQPIRPLTA
jgi:cytochrome P450